MREREERLLRREERVFWEKRKAGSESGSNDDQATMSTAESNQDLAKAAKPPAPVAKKARKSAKTTTTKTKKLSKKALESGDWFFKCYCSIQGLNHDDGLPMLACERCSVWLHVSCLNQHLGHVVRLFVYGSV
jgi:hypothetical protein